MKYSRLTKEQFEALHLEFANFLAAQSIDKTEWEQLKRDKPEVAEEELDVFSDLIWEGVLSRTEYLEHYSRTHVFLFHCMENEIRSIVLKSLNAGIDLMSKQGIEWLGQNLFSEEVEIMRGKKPFTDRNFSMFNLIAQGAFGSDGLLYSHIENILT